MCKMAVVDRCTQLDRVSQGGAVELREVVLQASCMHGLHGCEVKNHAIVALRRVECLYHQQLSTWMAWVDAMPCAGRGAPVLLWPSVGGRDLFPEVLTAGWSTKLLAAASRTCIFVDTPPAL